MCTGWLTLGCPLLSCYVLLLSENFSPPHCVLKFTHAYGDLYWPSSWRQLFLFNLDPPVIDLSWKISHAVLCTAACLFSFGLNYGVSCFCHLAPETSDHLFFSSRLAQSVLAWLQSLMFFLLRVVRPFVVVMSFLVLMLMNFVLFLTFLSMPLIFASILFGTPAMTFAFAIFALVL